MAKKKKNQGNSNNGLALSYENKNQETKTLEYSPKKKNTSTANVKKSVQKSNNNVSAKANTTDENTNIKTRQPFSNESQKNITNTFDDVDKDVRTQTLKQQKEFQEKKKQEEENEYIKKTTTETKYDQAKKDADIYLKDTENEFSLARKAYQDKRSDELKKNNIDYQTKFDDKTKHQISYKEKNKSDVIENKPKEYDLTNVEKNVKKEAQKMNEASNELKYARYFNDAVNKQSEKVSAWDKTGGNLTRAISDLGSTLLNAGNNKYIDTDGNEKFLPSASEIKQDIVSQNYKTGVGKFLGDAAYNGSKILGAALVDAATAGIGGKALYWSDMAADNYENVINQGYDKKQALANTAVSTASEFATEKLLGGLTKNLTGGKSSGLQNAIANKLTSKTGNAAISNILASAGSEATEEFVQEYIDKINELATLKNSTDPKEYINAISSLDTLKDALYSGGIGAMTGGGLTALNNIEGKQVQQNLNYLNQYKNELVEGKENSINTNNIDKAINAVDVAKNNLFTDGINNVVDETSNLISTRQQALNNIQRANDMTNQIKSLNDNLEQIKTAYENKQISPIEANSMMQELMKSQQELINNYSNQKENSLNVENVNNQYYNDSNEKIIDREKNVQNYLKLNEENENYDGRTSKGNYEESNGNEFRGIPKVQVFNRMQGTMSENFGEGISDREIEQEYGTNESRRLNLEKAKNNVVKNNLTDELNNISSKLGIEVKTYNNDGSLEYGVADGNTFYIDGGLDENTAKSVFYHELLHNTIRNDNLEISSELKDIYNEYKNNDDVQKAVNSYIQNKGFKDENVSNQFKEHLFEEVMADMSAKKFNSYDVNYKLPEELAYRLNTALDDAVTEMKQNQKNTYKNDNKSIEKDNVDIQRFKELKSLYESGLLEKNSTLYDEYQQLKKLNESKLKEKTNQGSTKDSFLNENKSNAERILKINQDGTTEELGERPIILDKMPTNNEKISLKERYKKEASFIARKVINKNAELDRISKETKNEMLKTETDRLGIAQAEAQRNIGEGQRDLNGVVYKNFTDAKGKKVNMSIDDIWDDANKNGIDNKVLSEYLVNKLNLDRLEQGVDQFNIPAYESQDTIEKIESNYPQIKRCAENIWQYQKNQLQKKVDAGLISKESQSYFEENTPHYVRIQRSKGNSKNNISSEFNGSIKMKDPIQKVKGGVENILPLKETMAQYEIESTNAIRKNMVLNELAKSLNYGEDSDLISLDNDLNINPNLILKNEDGSYSATFFKEGKATTIPINKGIYEALDSKTHAEWEKGFAPTMIRKAGSLQRALLTDKNPIFLATNFFKDFGDAPLNSKYGTAAFLKNYPRAAADLFSIGKNKGNYSKLYEALGAAENSYFKDGQFVEDSKGKVRKAFDKVMSPIEAGNEYIEKLPRLTEFITTIEKNGYTVNDDGQLVNKNNVIPKKTKEEVISEALYNSAEITTNFKRGGTWSKVANRNGATFLNASIQGFDKQVRNFKELKNPKKAVQFLSKVAFLGVAPALINDAMYEDDDEYNNLQDYIKDEYYLFKSDKADDEWIRIPKGRVMSIFGAAARRTKEMSKGNKDAFNGLLSEFNDQVAPNNPLDNNIFSPFNAVATNKSWSGNQIESDYLQTLPTKERFDAKTSSLAKWLGEKTGYSPKKIDYLLDQYTGGIGDVMLPAMTNYAESDDDTLTGKLLKNPIKSKFTTNSTNKDKITTEYYDLLDDLKRNSNSSNATALDKAKYKYVGDFSAAKTALSDLYTQQREIQNNSSLSDKEKYKQAKAIQKQINDTMKETINILNNATGDSQTANINGTMYAIVDAGGESKLKKLSKNATENYNNLGLSISLLAQIDEDYNNISADRDSNGRAISGSKKKKFIEYLNSLNLDYDTKCNILKKYYKSYK